jgi:ribosomal protein S18 acetylase RimI-like enzyme
LALTSFPLTIQRFDGPRSQIRTFFELADDSPLEIDRYIETGEVLVARRRAEVVGHVQVICDGVQWEIKSIAVAVQEQHRGIGTALVRSVLQRAVLEGCIRVVVAAATADIDNLRFYQRLGFRMDRIERDAFSCDRGYTRLEVDGIALLDRVWFSFDVSSG